MNFNILQKEMFVFPSCNKRKIANDHGMSRTWELENIIALRKPMETETS